MTQKKRGHDIPPTSYRLTEEDKKALRAITDKVNTQSRTRISDKQVLQALILIGTKTSTKALLQALRELI